MVDLLKLIPDSVATIAVIIVVMMFLKNQRTYDQNLKDVTQQFADRVKELQDSFKQQIQDLTSSYLNSEQNFRNQIGKLFEDFVHVSTETISAVKQLESAVREIKDQIRNIK